MPWPIVKGSSRTIVPACLGLAFGVVSLFGSTVNAVSSEIGAKVCSDNPSAAQVHITQPSNDSISSQSVITLRGSLVSASQVIVDIDGSYNNTVAIAANQSVFSTDITVSKGTHTISVTANEICGGQDGSDEIVVTYEPEVQPSSGEAVPTVVNPTDEASGDGGTDGQPIAASSDGILETPFFRGVANVAQDIASAIGLSTTLDSSDTPTIVGVARVGITVAALTSVVMAGSIAPLVAHAYPGISATFHLSGHRYLLYLGWAIRGAGVLAMSIAYFI